MLSTRILLIKSQKSIKFMMVNVLMFNCFLSSAQSFNDNIISTSITSPMFKPSSYSLSFEHVLDKGYSLNVAQLSYKLNLNIIYDNTKAKVGEYNKTDFFDTDAYQFRGYSIVPELRYYFTWDAPMGFYFSLYGGYAVFNETYIDTDIGDLQSYVKKTTAIARGFGAGYQYKLVGILVMDVTVGYLVENLNSSIKLYAESEYNSLPKETDDGLYFNATLGFPF